MSAHTEGGRPRAYYPERAGTPTSRRTPGWDMGPERRLDDGRTLGRALGWFSIGLGVFEIAAPGRLTEFLGLDDRHENLVRLYGAREIATGIAILSQRTPEMALWSRVGGDVLDLATLGAAMTGDDSRRGRVALAMAMVAGVAALDALSASQLHRRAGSTNGRGR